MDPKNLPTYRQWAFLWDTKNCRLRMCRKCRQRFPRYRLWNKPLVSDLDMHNARALIHVGIANPRWRGKRSRHSKRMRIPQFYISGKRPIPWKSGKHRFHIRVPGFQMSHIRAETKWLIFGTRHSRVNFLYDNCCIFTQIAHKPVVKKSFMI